MPKLKVETAQGIKTVTVADGLSQAQLHEVADTVAQQFGGAAPEQAAPTQGGPNFAAMSGPEKQAFAEQQQVAAQPALGQGLVQGAVEGGKRLWGGAKQVFGQLQDQYEQYKADTPGVDISVHSAKATNEEILRRTMEDVQSQEGNPNVAAVRDVAAGATELGALTLGPEAALPKATTMLGAVIKNFTTGTVGNAFQFNPENKQSRAALIAGSSGSVLPLIPFQGTYTPAFLNYLGRKLAQATGGRRAEAATAAAKSALPNLKLTIAQETGVPQLAALERASYNSDMINYYADQTDNVIHDFEAAFQQPVPGGKNLVQQFAVTRDKADRALRKLRSNASTLWESGMSRAASIAAKTDEEAAAAATAAGPDAGVRFQGSPIPELQGGPARIPPPGGPAGKEGEFIPGAKPGVGPNQRTVSTPNLTNWFNAESKAAQDPLENLFKTTIPKQALRNLSGALAKGELSPQQLASLLKGISRVQRDGSPEQAGFATRLRRALDGDLDVLQEQGGAHLNAAVQQILDTRAEYKRAVTAADVIANSASYKLLGVGDDATNVSSEEILDRFKGLPASHRKEVGAFLQEHNPHMLMAMRQEAVDTAVRRAANPERASADSINDLRQLSDELFNAKGADLRTSGLWSDADLAKMQGVREGIRTISNFRPEVGKGGTAILPQDIAPNVISMSPIFIARQLARVLTGAYGSDVFTNPRVLDAMRVMNRTTTGSAVNTAARATLIRVLHDDYPPEQKKDDNAQVGQ